MPQRLFSTFPAGWPGFGLLLLRVVMGVAALMQGAAYFGGATPPTLATWVLGILAIVSGAGLLIGVLTPIAAAISGIGAVATGGRWIPVPAPNWIEGLLPVIFAASVSAAVVLLGPGAFSVDGRKFGRREIIIPSHKPR